MELTQGDYEQILSSTFFQFQLLWSSWSWRFQLLKLHCWPGLAINSELQLSIEIVYIGIIVMWRSLQNNKWSSYTYYNHRFLSKISLLADHQH